MPPSGKSSRGASDSGRRAEGSAEQHRNDATEDNGSNIDISGLETVEKQEESK